MDDLSIFFDDFILFFLLNLIVSYFLYLTTRKINFGVIDCINFYWVFTFGTSYSVVLFLYLKGYIEFKYFYIILYFYLIFLLSFYLGKKVKFRFLRFKSLYSNKYNFLFIIYTALLIFYFSKIDFSVFMYSRFEANKGGLGIISRIMDVIRLIIIGYISVDLYLSKKKIYKFLFLMIFIAVSSFANGSKYSILESIYMVGLIICILRGYTYKLNYKTIIIGFILFLIFLGYSLFFTSKVAEALGYTSKYTIFPEAIEMLILRIIANGDMYYLSLPNGIIDIVLPNTSSFLETLLRPFLGSGLTQIIFSSNSESISIGRAIWLYWYPDSLAGGSVDHFDLISYKLGYFYGTILTFFIGFFLGNINRIKTELITKDNKKNILNIIFFCFIYNKSYLLLLSPVTGISVLIDGLFIFIVCYMAGVINER